jgi:Tfp pilus assembly protein PilN
MAAKSANVKKASESPTKERNALETIQTQQTRKRRFPVILVVTLLLLVAGTVVIVNLFNQSLVTADQKHDHDNDGKPDH